MKSVLVGAAAMLAGAVAGIGGCADVQPVPLLPADAFVSNQPITGPGSGEPVDHPGPLVYDAEHRPVAPASDEPGISKTVREGVRSPADEAQPPPNAAGPSVTPSPEAPPATSNVAAAPSVGATQPEIKPGPSTGQWQSVGAVLAVVNGEPIYSHKVIDTIARPLAAEARSGSPQHFKAVADDMVTKQIREFIENELEYAAAQQSLEKADEQIAAQITSEWRKDQIRRAGGSDAVARQRAAEDGFDFEDLVRQQYRLNLTRLYYQKKIFPLIHVTASDMRDYYQANLAQFQKPAAAKFRVLFISSEMSGGREQALDKAKKIYDRAKSGEDFGVLAGDKATNDDPSLINTNGTVGSAQGWMEKGEYASEKVEQAVWDMHPGDVSPPIDAPHHGQDGFYVVKLDDIHPGVSEPFEKEAVQAAIHDRLHREQFARLREAHRRDLLQKAVIRENPEMLQTAMEMVMQRYQGWVDSR